MEDISLAIAYEQIGGLIKRLEISKDGTTSHLIREFKKLRRQLQRKRHIKIELCVKLSLLRLFHVDHVVQNTRIALSLAWYERFSCKGKEWKIYCCELALSSEPQIRKFHVVVSQTTSNHCTKKRACRTYSTIIFLDSTNQINDLWHCRWRRSRQILNFLVLGIQCNARDARSSLACLQKMPGLIQNQVRKQ